MPIIGLPAPSPIIPPGIRDGAWPLGAGSIMAGPRSCGEGWPATGELAVSAAKATAARVADICDLKTVIVTLRVMCRPLCESGIPRPHRTVSFDLRRLRWRQADKAT